MPIRAPQCRTLVLLLAVAACTVYSAEGEVQEAAASFLRAFNTGDVDATMEHYISTPGVSTSGDGLLSFGREAIRLRIVDAYRELGGIELRPDSIRVTLIGDRAAVTVFEYVLLAGTGDSLRQLRGAMTIAWERTPEGWRVVNDHTSSLTGVLR